MGQNKKKVRNIDDDLWQFRTWAAAGARHADKAVSASLSPC